MKTSLYYFLTVFVGTFVALIGSSPSYAQDYNVLFVGDSITTATASSSPTFASYGAEHVADQRPGWTVDTLAVTNTADFLRKISANTATFKGRDVVYFNTGLHSIVDPNENNSPYESVSTYETNLDAIVTQLREAVDPDTRLIWRNTTPVRPTGTGPGTTNTTASRGRNPADVPIYNDAAVAVITARGVEIDDVYSILLPHVDSEGNDFIVFDGTHWSTAVQENIITPHVINTIETVPEPSSILLIGIGSSVAMCFRRRHKR